MNQRKAYQAISFLGLVAGLVLFVYLVQRTGLGVVLSSIRLMGASFLLLLLISAARHYLRTAAWYHAIEPQARDIHFLELFQVRLVGEAVTDLTFAGPFLGETVKALVVSRRLTLTHTLSSLFIENLLYSVSAALFILTGLFLFLANFTMAKQMQVAIWIAGIAVVLVVTGAYVMIGHRWLPVGKLLDFTRTRDFRWPRLERGEGKVRAFEENVYGFFGQRRGLFLYIFLLELLTNFTGVIEAWLILRVTTGQGSLLAAFLIESVNRVVNTVFAFVPLRVGVEEGGAAITLRALGYSLADGVSLAIIRKIRTFFWVAVGLGILARISIERRSEPARAGKFAVGGKLGKRLIVNADDFGLTEKVNDAIIEGHRSGIITSASLLANGAAFDSAANFARHWGTLSVGIHLNLTQGKPVSDPALVPNLVSRHGRFAFTPLGLAGALATRRVPPAEMECELRAQVEKVEAAGVHATHLDGHKHIQALPAVRHIVFELAREYGIRAVRCPVEDSVRLQSLLWRNLWRSSTILRQYLGARAVGMLASSARREAEEVGLHCPTYFYGLTQTGFLDRRTLEEILLALEAGVSELMCHPGYVDRELEASGTRLLTERERELEVLTAPETRTLIGELEIELINFQELAEAG